MTISDEALFGVPEKKVEQPKQEQFTPAITDRGSAYSVPVKSAMSDRMIGESMRVDSEAKANEIPTESGIVNPDILSTEAGKNYVPVISSMTSSDMEHMQKEYDRPKGFIENAMANRFNSQTAKVANAYSRGGELSQNIDKYKDRVDPKGLSEELGAMTGALVTDLPLMALGAVTGGAGVAGAFILPRVLGKFADIKMKINKGYTDENGVVVSGREFDNKDIDPTALALLPEVLKGGAQAGALKIAGVVAGKVADKAMSVMENSIGGIIEKSGAEAFNTALSNPLKKPIEFITRFGLEEEAMTQASHYLDNAHRDAKERFKNALLGAGFEASALIPKGSKSLTDVKESKVDIMDELFNKFKNVDNREVLRSKFRGMLQDGKTAEDIFFSIGLAERDAGVPLAGDTAKQEIVRLLRDEEQYIKNNDDNKFDRKPFDSDLTLYKSKFDEAENNFQDQVLGSGSIKNYAQAVDNRIKSLSERKNLINKYLDDPKSDLSTIVEFNNTVAGVKESMDNKDTSNALYRNVKDVNRDSVNKFMGVSKEMSDNMYREMAITSNRMPDSGWIKVLHGYNSGIGSVSRVIYRHLGPKVYEYIYRPLRTAVSHAEMKNKVFSDTLNGFRDNLSEMEQMEISRYFVERQVKADGTSAIKGKELDFKGAEKKEYEELNDKQKEVVDYLQDYTNEMLSDINLSRKLLGKKAIEGLTGYAPLIAKDMAQYKKNFMMETDMADFLKNGEKDAKFLKERIGSDIPVIENVFDSFPKYDRYMNQKIYVTPVTSRVIDFADTLSRHQKHAGEYVRSMALDTEGSMIDGSQWQDGIRKLAGASSIGKLAWNLTSVMAQTLAVIPATVNLGPKALIRSSLELLTKADKRKSNREISPALQASTSDMSVQLAENTFDNKTLKWFVEKGMTPLKVIDRGVRQVVWNASYNRALESGQSKSQAISTADRETVSTQGSAERMDRAPLFRGSTGKLFAAIQSFKINEFHYMISDVMGVDRPNEFIKYFPKDNAEKAIEYAKENGWDLHQLDNGTYTVYKKEGLSNFIRASRDFGVLLAGMGIANMAFGMLEAETGIPINNPYPSPLDAFYKDKYGVTYAEYMAGASPKGSNLTQRDQNIRSATQALIEATSIIPFLRSPEGAIIGTMTRAGDKMGRGLATQNYGQALIGLNELSGLAGNPVSAPISKADKFYRDGKEQAKAYMARDKKGLATQKEKNYNSGAVKQYFLNVIKDQRDEDKVYRQQVKQEKGGDTGGLKPMKSFGEMKSMKKFGE